MKLTDMKRSDDEKKSDSPPTAIADDSRDYPYGLQLSLDEESLKKLKLPLPKVGATLNLRGMGVVTSIAVHHDAGKDKQRHINIQLQKLAVDPEAMSMEEAVDEGIEEAGRES